MIWRAINLLLFLMSCVSVYGYESPSAEIHVRIADSLILNMTNNKRDELRSDRYFGKNGRLSLKLVQCPEGGVGVLVTVAVVPDFLHKTQYGDVRISGSASIEVLYKVAVDGEWIQIDSVTKQRQDSIRVQATNSESVLGIVSELGAVFRNINLDTNRYGILSFNEYGLKRVLKQPVEALQSPVLFLIERKLQEAVASMGIIRQREKLRDFIGRIVLLSASDEKLALKSLVTEIVDRISDWSIGCHSGSLFVSANMDGKWGNRRPNELPRFVLPLENGIQIRIDSGAVSVLGNIVVKQNHSRRWLKEIAESISDGFKMTTYSFGSIAINHDKLDVDVTLTGNAERELNEVTTVVKACSTATLTIPIKKVNFYIEGLLDDTGWPVKSAVVSSVENRLEVSVKLREKWMQRQRRVEE